MTTRTGHHRRAYLDELTSRQREVLALVARGRTNGEIATELGIGFDTVKTHVSEILGKLGVESREEAATAWREHKGLARRAKGRLHGLLLTNSVRWAAVGSVTLAGVAALTFAVLPLIGGNADADQPIAAREKAAFLANMHRVKTTGWPVEASEFTVDSIVYLQAVTSVETNMKDYIQEFATPKNVWRVELHEACPPPDLSAVTPNPCKYVIVVEDGSGELLAGGHLGLTLERYYALPSATRAGASPPVELKRLTSEGITFWLYLEEGRNVPWGALHGATMAESGGLVASAICLTSTSSEAPGGLGSGCSRPEEFAAMLAGKSFWVGNYGSRVAFPAGLAIMGYMHGLASPEVLKVRAYSNTGQVVTVETGPIVDILGTKWRGWIAVTPDSQQIDRVEALDGTGAVIATESGMSLPDVPVPVPPAPPVTPSP